MSFITFYELLDPRGLNEPYYGAEGFDIDLHGPKFRRNTPEMQEQERIAERRRNHQFVDDEPVHDAQNRLLFLIPRRNLRIPFSWFHNDRHAEEFFKAVARASDVSVHSLGKSNMGSYLNRFLDVVLSHRGLRMKKDVDPPRMTLQDRRDRHWQAVIEDSSLARDFSPRLARHIVLMLVGASLDFTKSKGVRSKSSDLNSKIDKLSEWYEENDPRDLAVFESFEPERQELPNAKGQAEPKSKRRYQGNGLEKSKPKVNSRKRKAQADHPSANARKKRPFQPRPPVPPPHPNDVIEPLPPLLPPRPNDRVELPERLAKAMGRDTY